MNVQIPGSMTRLCWLGWEEVMTVDMLLLKVVAGEEVQHKHCINVLYAIQSYN
jgi:hypothetical protein